MCNVIWQELELRCRGAADLAEAWKENHEEVRKVWALEDLVAAHLGCIADFHQLIDFYKANGRLPNSQVRFSYVVEALERFLLSATIVDNLAQIVEAKSYVVQGMIELRTEADILQRVVEEDRLATRVAASALEGWD